MTLYKYSNTSRGLGRLFLPLLNRGTYPLLQYSGLDRREKSRYIVGYDRVM
jgi:hypothetical protein